MKQWQHILIATILAVGPALALAGVPASPSGISHAAHVTATPGNGRAPVHVGTRHGQGFDLAGHTSHASARAAAVHALHQLVGAVGRMKARGHAHALSRLPSNNQAMPAGFPLAAPDMATLRQAHIGWGFAVYDVLPGNFEGHQRVDLHKAAQPTGEWRYAVIAHGKPIGLVSMARTPAGWKAVSFGGAQLSRNIGNAVRTYGAQPGLRMRYVRIPQATADFIEIKRDATPARYVPLQAARTSLHLNSARPLAGAAIVPGLRRSVERRLKFRH